VFVLADAGPSTLDMQTERATVVHCTPWAIFYDTSNTTFSPSILARTTKGALPASGEMKMDQNRRSESGSSSMAFSSKHLLKNLLPSSSL